MDTLTYLANRLGKTVSFFLEETAVTSENLDCMTAARAALQAGQVQALEEALARFREPDETFHEERQLLQMHLLLLKSRQALQNGQKPFAASLLRQALALEGLYLTDHLRRSFLILLGQAGEPVCLPPEDDALLVLAEQADTPTRRLALLAAAEDHTAPQWNYLQAEAEFSLGRYADAAEHYAHCEQTQDVLARQEVCYRELGDFKQAYEYACRQRVSSPL